MQHYRNIMCLASEGLAHDVLERLIISGIMSCVNANQYYPQLAAVMLAGRVC